VTGGVFAAVLRSLSAEGVAHVVLRDHPAAAAIRDLDLLIDQARLADVLRLAGEIGFCEVPARRYNPGKRVLRSWGSDGPRLIDLHERLIHRGLEYLDAGRVLGRRCRRDGWFGPSREDELLTLFLHNVLGKGALQPKHLHRLRSLLAAPLDEAYIESHLGAFGIADIVGEARRSLEALAGDPALVRAYRRRLMRRLRRHGVANLWRVALVRADAIGRAWFPTRRGALVAFVGPDGCGKSAITGALKEEFHRAAIAAEVVYLGPWGRHALPLHRLVRRFNLRPQGSRRAGVGRAAAARQGMLRRRLDHLKGVAFFVLLGIELWFRYLWFVRPALRRGRLVLADRYIYDIMVGYKNRRLARHEALRAWLCRWYPKPDVTILLDAAPEVIHARKAQFAVDQLEFIRATYQALRADFDLQPLDTSVSVRATLEDFRRRLLPRVLKALRP
jgi:thymidylate kinase